MYFRNAERYETKVYRYGAKNKPANANNLYFAVLLCHNHCAIKKL